MIQRFPHAFRTMKGLTAGLLLAPLVLNAQPPVAKPVEKPTAPMIDQGVKPEEIQIRQEEIKKNFQNFKDGLFRLANRLEKSERQEAKDQAKSIKKALEESDKLGIEQQFSKLVTSLRSGTSEIDLNKAAQEDKDLVKMLQIILAMLETDSESQRLKEERMLLEAYLKELKNIKERQQNNQARTDSKGGNKDNLSKEQGKLKEETDDVAKRMNGKDGKDGKDGGKKDDRAEAKAEPKSGEKSGEGKGDTAEAKSDGKDGTPKDGGKASEGKPGKDGKDGAASEGKKAPDDGKDKDASGGKPSAGEPKKDDANAKPSDGKPSEGAGKGAGEGKGESKPSDGKGQGGEGKGDGGKPGSPPPMGGQPGGGQSGPKGDGQPGQPGQPGQAGPPGGDQAKKDLPGRKEVQEAVPYQSKAEDQIQKDKRPDASKNQDKAIENLAKAIQELEKRLKQIREEEMKKLLANVEARCQRMLAMQIDVYQKTKNIDEELQKNGGQLGQAERQKALGQSEAEGQIVLEAEKCLTLLASEGSAVAFAKVLEEVREDMIAVQRRLNSAIVDKDTQTIEENIIAMLKDMIDALKKAQKELGDQKPSESNPSKPGNKKLIDLLAELKLIRSLQVQVNNRTKMYGDKAKTEQSKDELVQRELKQLSNRQLKLQEMVEKLDKGENEK